MAPVGPRRTLGRDTDTSAGRGRTGPRAVDPPATRWGYRRPPHGAQEDGSDCPGAWGHALDPGAGDPTWEHSTTTWASDASLLLATAVALVVATALLLARLDPRRPGPRP
jgi:hypothetical protein